MISQSQKTVPTFNEQQMIRAKCFHPSGAFAEFRKEEVEQSILDRFDAIVAACPNRIAVRTRPHVLTYAELNAKANRVAHAILAQPGSGSDPVALLFENGAPFVIASLGALKAGRIQMALESNFPRARLKYVLEHSQASVLVTDNANLSMAPQLGDLPVIDLDALGGRFSGANPGVTVRPDAIAAIDYTSGSTGQPKGVAWTHRGMLHAVMRHTHISRMCIHDRLVMFRASLRAYLYALLNGAAYYPADLREEEPTRLAEWMIAEKITVY
ncbi:MAG: AMP-binding protein, partial [Candidatus Binatia bacterium]